MAMIQDRYFVNTHVSSATKALFYSVNEYRFGCTDNHNVSQKDMQLRVMYILNSSFYNNIEHHKGISATPICRSSSFASLSLFGSVGL